MNCQPGLGPCSTGSYRKGEVVWMRCTADNVWEVAYDNCNHEYDHRRCSSMDPDGPFLCREVPP